MFLIKRGVTAKSGFTIIEVVLAVALLLIVLSVVFVSAGQARKNARNDARRNILKDTQLALEQYRAKFGQYPSTCTSGGHISNNGEAICDNNINNSQWFYSYSTLPTQRTNSGNWIPDLVSEGFVSSLPTDPLGNPNYSGTPSVSCTSATFVRLMYKSTGYNYKLRISCGYEGSNIASEELRDLRWAGEPILAVYSGPKAPPGSTCPAADQTNVNKPYCW